MATHPSSHLNGTGYAAETVTKPPDWHGLVAWDLLFNNLATGLFMSAALGELLRPDDFTSVAKVAYPLALLFLVIDLGCLVLDLGDPLRFHHMLRVFKPTSPMSLGTWCLTAFSFPLAAAAGLGLLPDAWPGVELGRKIAVAVAFLPAFGSALYKGVLISTNSQPGWRDARWLGCYITNSAILLGCAGLLVLSVLMGLGRATELLRAALAPLIVLNALILCLLVADLRAALVQLYPPVWLWAITLLAFGAGAAVPLALVVEGGPLALLAAVPCVLVGCIAVRFAIVKFPHALSRQLQGRASVENAAWCPKCGSTSASGSLP